MKRPAVLPPVLLLLLLLWASLSAAAPHLHQRDQAAISPPMVPPTDVQPALDLVTRNYGTAAAAALRLSVSASACADAKVKAPCFVLTEGTDGSSVKLSASTMSELTYGIGWVAAT